jgi:hypothetical protein
LKATESAGLGAIRTSERKETLRLGGEKMSDQLLKSGFHWSFGWLRRTELDDENGYCYEECDGDLLYTSRPDHKTMCHLDCFRDSKTGETYLVFSQGPVKDFVDRRREKEKKA